MEKNPKSEPSSDSMLKMGSSPESPSKTNTISSQLLLPSSPVNFSVHSPPVSPPNRSTNSSQLKSPSSPTRSPAGSPVHLSLCSTPDSLSKCSSHPTSSFVHLTIGSSPESSSKSNIRSLPTRSPVESPARSSVCSDYSTLTNGYSTRKEKDPSSPSMALVKVDKIGRENGQVEEGGGGGGIDQSGDENGKVDEGGYKERGGALVPMKIHQIGGEKGRVEEDGGGGGRRRIRPRPGLSIFSRGKRDKTMKWAGLGFRGIGALLCLVSFSVMVSNRNMGWAMDSFYRYKEFRYFISVNVIGFIYSSAQAFDLTYHLVTGKYILHNPYRYYFDFAIDQIITYLLISASSSATTRIDDWASNWGKDKFTDVASGSVSTSYLAFVTLAFSSLISGYTLSTSNSM